MGDRYILDQMIKSNCKLGGEPSGHILLSDFAKTGDGLLTAIKVLSLLKKSGQRASKFLRPFKPVPQSLKNLKNTPFLSKEEGAMGILRGAGVFQYWTSLYDKPSIKMRDAI